MVVPKSRAQKQKHITDPGEDHQPKHLPHLQIDEAKTPGANHKNHHHFQDKEDGDISFFIFIKMVVMPLNDALNKWYFHKTAICSFKGLSNVKNQHKPCIRNSFYLKYPDISIK